MRGKRVQAYLLSLFDTTNTNVAQVINRAKRWKSLKVLFEVLSIPLTVGSAVATFVPPAGAAASAILGGAAAFSGAAAAICVILYRGKLNVIFLLSCSCFLTPTTAKLHRKM